MKSSMKSRGVYWRFTSKQGHQESVYEVAEKEEWMKKGKMISRYSFGNEGVDYVEEEIKEVVEVVITEERKVIYKNY